MKESAVATGTIYLDVFIDKDSECVCENIKLSFVLNSKARGVS